MFSLIPQGCISVQRIHIIGRRQAALMTYGLVLKSTCPANPTLNAVGSIHLPNQQPLQLCSCPVSLNRKRLCLSTTLRTGEPGMRLLVHSFHFGPLTVPK